MSDVFYPLGLIEKLNVQRVNRTLQDEFEDGSTVARRLWTAQYFKRRFTIDHAPLSYDEFRWLESFFAARDGQYDSFFFRDNTHRNGTARVRLASPFEQDKGGALVYKPRIILEETSPTRALPAFDEVAGTVHYDPHRQIVYSHKGATFFESTVVDSSQGAAYPLTWSSASQPPTPEFAGVQYPAFTGLNSIYAQSAANISNVTGLSQPAFILFVICRCENASARRMLFSLGTTAATQAMGLQIDASNNIKPYLGSTETWTNCVHANTNNQWVSIAIGAASGSNDMYMWVNGVIKTLDTNTRSFVNGLATMFAAPDLTLKVASGTIELGQVVLYANFTNSTLAQVIVRAWHNLFRYQYGLAAV